MSPNTKKRIASALILASITAVCIYLGAKWSLGFMLLIGILANDEIYVNFLRKERKSKGYFSSQLLLIGPFSYLFFVDSVPHILEMFVNAAVFLNALYLLYLFTTDIDSKVLTGLLEKWPILSSVLIGLPLIGLGSIVYYERWRELLLTLLLVNFGMDTGAWFFGKNFGKHKLWEIVSPKKTIEGLLGGILVSGIVGGLYWHFLFEKLTFLLFIFFCFLGLMSQLGDLVQSKLKRQFEIKDSSNLIPGHGGAYDRVDSLFFLAPFFSLALRSIYFN